jgi:hypothetical protein
MKLDVATDLRVVIQQYPEHRENVSFLEIIDAVGNYRQ